MNQNMLNVVRDEMTHMSTEHIKIAAIHLYSDLASGENYSAYRLAMIALEGRISEDELNHFLDGLSLGRYGTTCQGV